MRVMRWLLCALLLSWQVLAVAVSDVELKPLLIDIADWQAKAVQSKNIDMDGTKIVIAQRSYQQGKEKTIQVQVGLMPSAIASAMQTNMSMNMETKELMMSHSNIDAFTVYQNHDKRQQSGSIFVVLGAGNEKVSPSFNLSYRGIEAQQALTMAKQFDWKKMQTTTEALLK